LWQVDVPLDVVHQSLAHNITRAEHAKGAIRGADPFYVDCQIITVFGVVRIAFAAERGLTVYSGRGRQALKTIKLPDRFEDPAVDELLI
jgi:hypothetical protein